MTSATLPISLVLAAFLTCPSGLMRQDHDGAAPPAEAVAAAEPTSAEELLTLLEADAANLDNFRGRIRVEKENAILGDVEANIGDAYFQFDHDQDVKRFAVRFEQRVVGDRMMPRQEMYIFDGVWLVERVEERKEFIARQMVAPGEKFDPLRLGEGPIPLPIAQKKDDVLARFTAELIGPPEGEDAFLARALRNVPVYGLQLVPRPGLDEAKEFERVRIWFDRTLLIPVGVEAIGTGGDRTVVWLGAVARNVEIDPKMFDTTPPSREDGWRIDIREWNDS